MKAIVYWPDRLFAERVEAFRNVTHVRVNAGTRTGGYSITYLDKQGKAQHAMTTSTDPCEVVLLPDNEKDIGQ